MGKRLDDTIQLLIPPSLVALLVVTIVELFYSVPKWLGYAIDIFDMYVVVIFAIDLYYRWFETPQIGPYVKKHWLDIIATIPFNLIFLGIEGLALVKALRGVRIISRVTRLARFTRILRLVRFGARAPRFFETQKGSQKGQG